MKAQRFWKLSLVLVLLLASGRAAPVSALPGEAASVVTQEGAGFRVVARPDGTIVYADTCSREDVQDAVDAAQDGDFVVVPAGECTWETPPAGHTPALSIGAKAITVQGAGIGETVITDGTDSGSNNYLIGVDGVEGKPFRITGFTFTDVITPAGLHIAGDSKSFRVDHCRFENQTWFITALEVIGYTYGVVDHCEFLNMRLLVRNDGDAAWQRPLTLGTANAVYVEDCSFDATVHANTVDGSNGGRYVFRYNSVHNSYVEAHTCNAAGMRGTFSYEIYENVFTGSQFSPFSLRAGTGVVFNNTIAGAFPEYSPAEVRVDNRRSCENPCPAAWGLCDGTSAVDGNTPGMSGYPCLDQIGRSTDTGLGTPQTLEPMYEWGNWDTYHGADVDIVVNLMCPEMADHIVEGRDYYNDTERPGYTPYEYPHPLTQDLVLTGTPDSESIRLNWEVAAWTYLPPTSTWRITYYSETVPTPVVRTGIVSSTDAYTLTGLVNFEWYTVTLDAMVGGTSWMSDTVTAMPTDIFVRLPLVMRED